MKRRRLNPTRRTKPLHENRRPPEQLPVQEAEERIQSRVFRVNFVYGIMTVACVGLLLRLSYLQITKNQSFRTQAITTSLNTISVLPARGRIYDAEGNLLAYDQPVYSVFYTQVPGVNTEQSEIKALANQLAKPFGVKPQSIIAQVNSNTASQDYATIKLFTKITERQLAFIGENGAVLPGISVQTDAIRTYPYGDLAGQALGYVGPISPNQQNRYVNQLGYQFNQIVGQAGLESTYEQNLQGTVGQQIETVGSGNVVNQASYATVPKAGDNIQLTLDGPLEADAQEALQNAISSYESKNHQQITDAAAVVLDVRTGGVLAMVSYPFLDPNWFVNGTINKHAAYISTPGVQQNNVIQNPHYPGSTVKPANLLTGLESGVVTPTYNFYDPPGKMLIGTYPIGEDASYGWVNDIKAIAVSDDKFFYTLGLNIGKWFGSSSTNGGAPLGGFSNIGHWRATDFIRGIMQLAEGEFRFGLGRLTGIDLPNEQSGAFYIENSQGNQVPLNLFAAKQSLQKTGEYQNDGSPSDLANMAFGQSQQVTPIQLAQYVATLADGGNRIQPHLLERVLPPGMHQSLSHAKVKPISVVKPHVQATLKLNPTYLSIVRQGMYEACNVSYGTAYNSFNNAPYKAAGKTGTAEMYMNGQPINNSVFIGYAPYDHPQIAVAVMVPGAGFGAVTAVPIARTIMDDYFNEHHASFMPKSGWTSDNAIPFSWFQSPAYQLPENAQ